MKNTFYLVTATYCSYMCKPFTTNLVIGEPIAAFLVRNKKKTEKSGGDTFFVLQYSEISRDDYFAMLPYNPTQCSFIRCRAADRGEE